MLQSVTSSWPSSSIAFRSSGGGAKAIICVTCARVIRSRRAMSDGQPAGRRSRIADKPLAQRLHPRPDLAEEKFCEHFPESCAHFGCKRLRVFRLSNYHQQYLAKNPGGYCGLGGTGVGCPIGLGAE